MSFEKFLNESVDISTVEKKTKEYLSKLNLSLIGDLVEVDKDKGQYKVVYMLTKPNEKYADIQGLYNEVDYYYVGDLVFSGNKVSSFKENYKKFENEQQALKSIKWLICKNKFGNNGNFITEFFILWD